MIPKGNHKTPQDEWLLGDKRNFFLCNHIMQMSNKSTLLVHYPNPPTHSTGHRPPARALSRHLNPMIYHVKKSVLHKKLWGPVILAGFGILPFMTQQPSLGNRHRGLRRPLSPATPPYMRVRIRRFGGLSRNRTNHRRKPKLCKVGIRQGNVQSGRVRESPRAMRTSGSGWTPRGPY